jgi:hypothetical protein
MNIYRCNAKGDEPKYTSGEYNSEARRFYECLRSDLFKQRSCKGPELAERDEPELKKKPGRPPKATLPPGIDAETDALIRKDLARLADTPRPSWPSIASELVQAYGDGIRSARTGNHGWQKIAKVFRSHGLHVGEKSLQARIEQA